MRLMNVSSVTVLPIFIIATLFIAASTDATPFDLIPRHTRIARNTIHYAKHQQLLGNVQLDDALQELLKIGADAVKNPNTKIQQVSTFLQGQELPNLDDFLPVQNAQKTISKHRQKRSKKRGPKKRGPKKAPKKAAGAGSKTGKVVALVNKERAKRKLKPLKVNRKLANVAGAKSRDMRDNNYFAHTSPKFGSADNMARKAGIRSQGIGENIAMGQKTAAAVMKAWMNSPGHRSNILNSKYKEIGVGYAKGGSKGPHWTQMFRIP